ncbi:hypothetical protein G3570_16030 [Balneolaceae bacterium YR4-1]|uniref:EpsG family protein n=1 Tax=Halalkalibaculum roseum TaxID=2709311 RepID=A0A6M1SYH2_9BACT|nr:EpsG family protein [Halalkalibaculum roseum]NGP78152.1 hypothetical protein [Halalkalibaculum roseum]
MVDETDKKGYYAGILFLIWPLLSLITAFKNYKSSWGKNILWAFVAFYGLSFAIGAGNSNSDFTRYIANIEYLHSVNLTLEGAWNYYLQSGEIDFVRIIIDLIISRFTDSQPLITLVFATIYGYFFSRNMWFVLERLEGKLQLITILLYICFFLVIPIWNMNGWRMFTAAHIFIYGLLLYLYEDNKKGILISTSTIIVHFSFIVPVGVLLCYLIFGTRLVVYFCFFVGTFFLSEINIEVFNSAIENYAPEIIQERTASYRSESLVESYRAAGNDNRNWYAIWYGKFLKWSVMGFLVVLFFKGRKLISEYKSWLSLASFTFLYYGVANLFSSIPSGGRYTSIANILALALIIFYIQNREQERVMKRFIILAFPALLLYALVQFRIGLYSISATSVLGNPLVSLFTAGKNISLEDFIRLFI